MLYTVYKITNKINGKFYIGTHKTKNLNDNYMGSGKYLRYAQEKHGLENFSKEILFVFDNPKQMYETEAAIVTEEFLADENTYNLKRGGNGGFDYLNDKTRFNNPTHQIDFLSEISKKVPLHLKQQAAEKGRKTMKAMCKENGKQPWTSSGFKNKKHSIKTRNVMSVKAKVRLSDPTKNSQYGTMWITDGIHNMKISNCAIIPTGWKQGRKIK